MVASVQIQSGQGGGRICVTELVWDPEFGRLSKLIVTTKFDTLHAASACATAAAATASSLVAHSSADATERLPPPFLVRTHHLTCDKAGCERKANYFCTSRAEVGQIDVCVLDAIESSLHSY